MTTYLPFLWYIISTFTFWIWQNFTDRRVVNVMLGVDWYSQRHSRRGHSRKWHSQKLHSRRRLCTALKIFRWLLIISSKFKTNKENNPNSYNRTLKLSSCSNSSLCNNNSCSNNSCGSSSLFSNNNRLSNKINSFVEVID